MFIHTLTGVYPYTPKTFVRDHPTLSFRPEAVEDVMLAHGCARVLPTAAPDFDADTHKVVELPPASEGGVWVQVWQVLPLSEQELRECAVRKQARMQADIADLWACADAYQSGYISGVAVGLLTMGVMRGMPKALAVQAWSAAVWDAYYTRKAAVLAGAQADLDFTCCGPMPHSVPELREEMGL